jgi:hypothetical protein
MPDLPSVRSWLRASKELLNPPLFRYLIFGSILGADTANDVDIVIVASEWDIRIVLKALKLGFRQRFDVPLHTQIFHVSQNAYIEDFIRRAKPVEEL